MTINQARIALYRREIAYPNAEIQTESQTHRTVNAIASVNLAATGR